jgi:hypothetical protein
MVNCIRKQRLCYNNKSSQCLILRTVHFSYNGMTNLNSALYKPFPYEFNKMKKLRSKTI